MDIFIARHAIFDRNLSLFGYELVFRSCQRSSCEDADGASPTLQVLANSLLSSGLDALACNGPIFINFGPELLTSQWTSLFPPKSVVVEIMESAQPNPEVIASCLNLKKMGYLLALDDVVGVGSSEHLTNVANFVKVDFRATSREEQLHLATTLRQRGKRMVAEKVETHEEFAWACEAGYDYFQGFFFARPTLLRGKHIPNAKINALRLLRELQRSEMDFDRLENVIKCDISLSYKLFRYVNSALFARTNQISSVRDALVILGELDVRRWITLATLPGLATGKTRELIVHALVRARFCEMISVAAHIQESQDAFLVGMFSLLDALVDRPLAELLAEMSLSQTISDLLLGTDTNSPLSLVYRLALAYELGDWPSVEIPLRELGMTEHAVSDAYLAAIGWSSEMFDLIGWEAAKPEPGNRPAKDEPVAENLMAMQKAFAPNRIHGNQLGRRPTTAK